MPPEKTRDVRLRELREMYQTEAGKQEVHRLLHECFPEGHAPPVGSLLFETILDHEFGPKEEPK